MFICSCQSLADVTCAVLGWYHTLSLSLSLLEWHCLMAVQDYPANAAGVPG